jgi:2-polyprenyl-3-methyl-5-hydroxy-6-metoxy-1,4-benzoquinol methylase
MINKIRELLIEFGISDEDSLKEFFPKVRDRDDISVLKCSSSDVILLSRSDHMELEHYESKADYSYWGVEEHRLAMNLKREDHQRRFDRHNHYFVNQDWLDVGTGEGGALEMFSSLTKSTRAIELQASTRESLEKMGYSVKGNLADIQEGSCDLVTLFHVFEHFTDPIEQLKELKGKLRPGGRFIIEVPHAKDFLIKFLELEAFKKFTFWSEHLILHTRQSLQVFMEAAGLVNVTVSGEQRYPLANHLHWLAKEKPGGQVRWGALRSDQLDDAYERQLLQLDMTDTLTAIGEVPEA